MYEKGGKAATHDAQRCSKSERRLAGSIDSSSFRQRKNLIVCRFGVDFLEGSMFGSNMNIKEFPRVCALWTWNE